MVSPAPGYSVTTGYGVPGSWCGGSHRAYDYAAPTGADVVAAWSGVVTGYTWGPSFGTQVIIDHDPLPDGSPGYWALYAHLSEKLVPAGRRVQAGQLVGRVGSTGNSTGPHLHFEVQPSMHWKCGGGIHPQPWTAAQPDTSGPPPQPPQEDDMIGAIFIKKGGTRYISYPLAGVYRGIPNPQTEKDIKTVLDRADVQRMEWSDQDVDNLHAFGVRID